MEEARDCNPSIETLYIGDCPVDELADLPDYMMAVRKVEDPKTSTMKYPIVLVPTGKLFPTATMDNVYSLEPNNDAIDVPERQVRTCYIENDGSTPTVKYTDSSHSADFIVIKRVGEVVFCQNSGVINIPEGHDYIIGLDYYAGPEGEPVTDLVGGTPIFKPISRTKLLIKNM